MFRILTDKNITLSGRQKACRKETFLCMHRVTCVGQGHMDSTPPRQRAYIVKVGPQLVPRNMAMPKQPHFMMGDDYYAQSYMPPMVDGYAYAPMMVGPAHNFAGPQQYSGFGGGLPTPPRVPSPIQDNAGTLPSSQIHASSQAAHPTMLPSPTSPPRMGFLASLPYSPAAASMPLPVQSPYGNYLMPPYSSSMRVGKHNHETRAREQSRSHSCSVCSKGFARPSALRTHMYTHTGEKPFRCQHPECLRSFSVLSNLRRHQRVHSVNNGP